MPNSGHTEEQIASVLWQVEAGADVAEICHCVKRASDLFVQN